MVCFVPTRQEGVFRPWCGRARRPSFGHLPCPTTPSVSDRGLRSFDAVIFDMDGVITDTASVHAAAWKDLFDAVLADMTATPTASFDISADYRRYVDGRTRDGDDQVPVPGRAAALASVRYMTRRNATRLLPLVDGRWCAMLIPEHLDGTISQGGTANRAGVR